MAKIHAIALIIACGIFGTPLSLFAGTIPTHPDTPAPKSLSKLLYVTLDKSQTYLIPYIERKLKNLRKPNSNIVLYDSVVSLNVLVGYRGVQATMMDDLNDIYKGRAKATPQSSSHKDTLVDLKRWLRGFQSLLAINVTALGELVEYQFILYDIKPNGVEITYKNSSSIFIDPKSAHYQADMNRGLDQVFESANRQPLVNLISNIKPIDDTLYFTTQDTLNLQPIVDDESIEEDRIYFWTQDSMQKLPIQPSKKDQSLTNLAPGRYNLRFRVSNGVNYSKTDTVKLNVYTRPRLTVSRPYDVSFFRKFGDRLVIQEYIFAPPQIDYLSDYLVFTDSTRFAGTTPNLIVRLTDKNGTKYAGKSYTFRPNFPDTLSFAGVTLIGSPDTMQTPIKAVRNNSYYISFVAKNAAMQSEGVKEELNVYRRWPLSLVYDVMIFPSDHNGLYHSWINAGLGLDLRLNRWLSGMAIVGTDLAQASFKHFYTDLIANLGPIREWSPPFNRLEGGPALLINHDNGNESTGFKFAYNFYGGGHTNLKLGGGFYNQNHVNYYAIHFTGDIFFNH
jgi:hypothetical protein